MYYNSSHIKKSVLGSIFLKLKELKEAPRPIN